MPPRRMDSAARLRGAVRRLLAAGCLAGTSLPAAAYTLTLTPASPNTIYLQVGQGTFTGGTCNTANNPDNSANCTYDAGASAGTNTTISTVSVSVTASAVGNSTAQAMTTNSAQANSFLDNYTFCVPPGQLYIGGFWRTTGNGNGSLSVTAAVPANLTSSTGGTIPFSQISWTTGGNGDTGGEPFPAGTFTAGAAAQNIGTIAQNQWAESCWTFSYANKTIPLAGTYTGEVVYTAAAP